jgi:hypothetical protein
MQIPLVVTLWEGAQFSGKRRTIVEDTKYLSDQVFNDLTSSIIVSPGPDYDAWKNGHGGSEPTVSLFEHFNYGGAELVLKVGAYPNINLLYNFGKVISSVRFSPAFGPIWLKKDIPLVVEIYDLPNFQGKSAVIVQNVANLPNILGIDFNDMTTSVRVKKGPNYVVGKKAQLFRDFNYMGGSIQLDPGDYPNLLASHGFDNIISSIKVE